MWGCVRHGPRKSNYYSKLHIKSITGKPGPLLSATEVKDRHKCAPLTGTISLARAIPCLVHSHTGITAAAPFGTDLKKKRFVDGDNGRHTFPAEAKIIFGCLVFLQSSSLLSRINYWTGYFTNNIQFDKRQTSKYLLCATRLDYSYCRNVQMQKNSWFSLNTVDKIISLTVNPDVNATLQIYAEIHLQIRYLLCQLQFNFTRFVHTHFKFKLKTQPRIEEMEMFARGLLSYTMGCVFKY